MIRERKRYTRKEQQQILNEISSGRITLNDAARKYGMSPSGISHWKIYFGMRPPYGKREKLRHLGPQSVKDINQVQDRNKLEQEVEQLKIKVAELYLENDFLKKAELFLSQNKKLDSSIITDQNLSQFVKPVR